MKHLIYLFIFCVSAQFGHANNKIRDEYGDASYSGLSDSAKSFLIAPVNTAPSDKMTPTAGFSISASPFCVGVNITVTDASTDATSWTWNFGSGATPATASGVGPHVVSYSTSGSKTISLTINGGASTASQILTVNSRPVLSGVLSTCIGSTTTLESDISGGSWTSSNPAVATVIDGVVTGVGTAAGYASSTAIITYTSPATSGSCSVSTTVTVYANPTLSGLSSVCKGESITLTPSISGGSWLSSNTTIATVSGGVVSGINNGNTTITYTAPSGCKVTKNISVFLKPVITGASTVCIGSTTNLLSSISGGTWSTSTPGIVSVSSTTGAVTGIAGGTAMIKYTTLAGCFSNFSVNVVALSVSGTTSFCAGTNTTLTANTAGGTWSSSNTDIATVSSTGVVTGVDDGTVVITYALGTCSVNKYPCINKHY